VSAVSGGVAIVLVAVAIAPAIAQPVDPAALQAEVGRLRARVAELEAENARLRGDAGLAAALSAAAEASVQVSFDEDSDTTTIATTPSRLVRSRGDRTRHWLTLQARHRGRERPPTVDDAQLVVETSASTGDYRGATALRLLIDGRPEECAVVRYATEPIIAGREVVHTAERETVVVSLPSAVLARLAAAHEVRATLGGNEFVLTPEQLSAARAFRKRLES
jgi:hypothetical protein